MLTEKELEDIRRKMLELEEEPPAGGWSRIQADIRPNWWLRFRWWISVGLLLLGIFSGFLMYEQGVFQERASPPQPYEGIAQNAVPPTAETSEIKNTHAAEAGHSAKLNEQGVVQAQDKPQRIEPGAQDAAAVEHISTGTTAVDEGETAVGENSDLSGIDGNFKTGPHTATQNEKRSAQPDRGASAEPESRLPQKALMLPAADRDIRQQPETGTAAEERAVAIGTGTAPNNSKSSATGTSVEQSEAEADLHNSVPELATISAGMQQDSTLHAGSQQEGTAMEADAALSEKADQSTTVAEVLPHVAGENTLAEEVNVGAEAAPAEKQLAENMLVATPEAVHLLPSIAPVGYQLDTVATFFIRIPPVTVADSGVITSEATVVNRDSKQLREWSLALFFAPRYAYKTYKPNGEDEVLITKFNNTGGSAKDRMGYELGISAARSITPRLHVETSLGFMKLKENVDYTYTAGKVDTLIRQVSANGEIQLKPVLATTNRQLVSSYAYGSWRIGANYYFWQNNLRRFNISLSGGVNLLLKGSTKVYTNGEWLETVEFPADDNILEQTNYNLLLGLGYNYALFRNYELSLMPMVNYYMGSTFKEREPFGLRPYSLGLNLQLRKRFIR
ncbi:hypothetical protein D770_23700 [Flammeovirgaceae bacterium 311]|nr:hypothetical protein D770_23700 [Flammeovirgaceae bacterium 311]